MQHSNTYQNFFSYRVTQFRPVAVVICVDSLECLLLGNGRYGFILQGGGKLLIGNVSDKTLSLEAQKDFNPIHFAHVHSTTAGGTDTENGEVPGMFAPSAKFKPSSMPFSG